MKGGGRPATGVHGYIPKRKGVRINEMFREQQGGGDESADGASIKHEQKGGSGPVTIRVQKDDDSREE
jgi:hypothetical protein